MSGSKSRGVPSEKQSAPTPRRAAFSKVDGLPHAIQSGGCARGDEGQHDLRGGEVRVLLEEVVLDRPDILEAVAVRGLGQLDLAEEARVLGAAGVGLDLVARDVRLDEEAELHPAAPSRARAR